MNALIEIERTNSSAGPKRVLRVQGVLDRDGVTVKSPKPFKRGECVCIRVVFSNGYRFIVTAVVVKANHTTTYRLKYKFISDEDREELDTALSSWLHKEPAPGASVKTEAAA